jgi:hypothetical protein
MPYSPRPDEEKSGRVLIRMPISMHKALSDIAQAEGISMNQFLCGVIAVAVGWRSEYKPQQPIEEIHNDVTWEMWRDRVRRGEVGSLG